MAATTSGIVTTTLNYFLPPEQGGDREYHAGTVGEKRRKYSPAEVHVKDIRGQEDYFTLDKHGFQLVKREFTEKTFNDEERIKEEYYQEVAQLIKDVTDASKVLVGSHVVRRRSWKSAFEAEKDLPDDARSVAPSNARFVHCDQSYDGARARIAELHPEEADKLDKCRWAIINVWKPFDHRVTRDGLCFADAFSIRDDELRPISIHFPKRRDSVQESGDDKKLEPPKQPDYYARDVYRIHGTIEAWQCAPPSNPDQHKWYYASEMNPNEALLLKIADSKRTVANKLMHTSFTGENDHGPERHSLEARCTVFWEDQPAE
ncbi:Putative hydroxylase/desaturase AsaB [Septoria linicola]|uniref:Hydroxylase/desaturase AsaB n=1 Tax=Septoria linicola TaxID=215465 RepID=A0A9Q9EHY8_9PEZI|nr:putative hydroxylase/desaturase AsaB [Septoria linicola]USW50519.1 Putative hydroxylase/desaturase AsaB [Septoria linicola]